MNKINLKNIIEKFSKIWDRDKLKSILTPHRDWKIILVVFSLFFVLLSIANIYFFMLLNQEKIFFKKGDVSVKKFEVLNVEGLKNIVEFFDNKEAKSKAFAEQKPNIVDPSL